MGSLVLRILAAYRGITVVRVKSFNFFLGQDGPSLLAIEVNRSGKGRCKAFEETEIYRSNFRTGPLRMLGTMLRSGI